MHIQTGAFIQTGVCLFKQRTGPFDWRLLNQAEGCTLKKAALRLVAAYTGLGLYTHIGI